MLAITQTLEETMKQDVSLEGAQLLQDAYDDLRLVDAYWIVQDVLYAKERTFDFWDKASSVPLCVTHAVGL